MSTDERQENFLAAFVEAKGNLDQARDVASISRSAFYDWLRKDEVFRQRFDEYRILLAADLEDEAVKRVLSPSATKGSDALATTLLKGLKRERYGDADKGSNNLQVIYVSGLRNLPRQGVKDGPELDSGDSNRALPAGDTPPIVGEQASEGQK